MRKIRLKNTIRIIVTAIIIVICILFIVNQYLFLHADLYELTPIELTENDSVVEDNGNTIAIISRLPDRPNTAIVTIIQKATLDQYNVEHIAILNAQDYYIEKFDGRIYDIKYGSMKYNMYMGPKDAGENYFTWYNNYGFYPKVTVLKVEYIFEDEESVKNLTVSIR